MHCVNISWNRRPTEREWICDSYNAVILITTIYTVSVCRFYLIIKKYFKISLFWKRLWPKVWHDPPPAAAAAYHSRLLTYRWRRYWRQRKQPVDSVTSWWRNKLQRQIVRPRWTNERNKYRQVGLSDHLLGGVRACVHGRPSRLLLLTAVDHTSVAPCHQLVIQQAFTPRRSTSLHTGN